jgi:ABC-2 type transport system permease protein
MRSIELTGVLAFAYLRGQLQYRANFLITVAWGLVFQLTGFLFIWVLLDRFGAIGGWTLGEVAFLYGLRLLVHALRGIVFGNVGRDAEWLIRGGELDRMLIRPLSPLLQMMTYRIPVQDIGNLIGGVAVLGAATALIQIDWSPAAVAFLLLAVVGGCLVEAAIELVCVSFSFRALSADAVFDFANNANNMFGGYPMTIYDGLVRFALTFGLPIAFIAYLPATVLLGRTGELAVPPALAYLAPVVGAALFALAYSFWSSQLRHYQSAGH